MPYVPSSVAKQAVTLNFPVVNVQGHNLIELPGGPFVMGSNDSKDSDNATAKWVNVDPVAIGQTSVTERQWHAVMGGQAEQPNHPKVAVSWRDAAQFLMQFNQSYGEELGFLREHEWEYGARGPAVNIRDVMEEEGVGVSDFIDWASDRFENFVDVLEMGARIHIDPKSEAFQSLLKSAGPIFAWRAYATLTGKGSADEVWSGQALEFGVKEAFWGPGNGFGAKNMSGNHWEWVADICHDVFSIGNSISPESNYPRVLRGGSWYSRTKYARSAYRYYFNPDSRGDLVGFRVGRRVSPQDSKNV